MYYIAAIPTDERFAEEFFQECTWEQWEFHTDYHPRFTPHASLAFQFRSMDDAVASLNRWACSTDPYVWRDFEIREG